MFVQRRSSSCSYFADGFFFLVACVGNFSFSQSVGISYFCYVMLCYFISLCIRAINCCSFFFSRLFWNSNERWNGKYECLKSFQIHSTGILCVSLCLPRLMFIFYRLMHLATSFFLVISKQMQRNSFILTKNQN